MSTRRKSTSRSKSVKKGSVSEPAMVLSVRGLLVISGIAVAAASFGVMQVKVQFDARDYAIEARRLQELTALRRDEVRKLEVHITGMKRGSNLRDAALEAYGMTNPTHEDLSELGIDETLKHEFAKASQDARESVEEDRSRYRARAKEVQ